MPKEIKDKKKFLALLKPRSKVVKEGEKPTKVTNEKKRLFIKSNGKITKFKIRQGRYLYTFIAHADTAKTITEGLDANAVEKIEIKKRKLIKKAGKK